MRTQQQGLSEVPSSARYSSTSTESWQANSIEKLPDASSMPKEIGSRVPMPQNLLKPRAGLEPFLHAVPVEESLHGRGVGLSPEVTLSGQDSPGVVPADHLDQVAAELP